MKKHALTIIAAGILAFIAISCNDAERAGTDNADTATIPAETTVPAGAPADGRDTTATPLVDPGVDTGMNQTPKI